MLALISLGIENGSRDAGSAAGAPDRSCWTSGLDILFSSCGTAERSVDAPVHRSEELMDRPLDGHQAR
jgi:hypothetical protein